MLNTRANNKITEFTNIKQIQANPINPAIVNNFNIIGGMDKSNTIIVTHDKDIQEFTFKTIDNNILGSFSILQLFKFLNNDCDSYLLDTNIGTSDIIITKYLYNPSSDVNQSYELISYLESPFTGNIELLVKLYADFIKVEDKINEDILTKSRDIAEKIKQKNNKFIYNILIRILKLSNTLTEQYKNDKVKRELLIRYSIGAVYKLSMMTQDEILIKKMQYETIQTDINKLNKIQENIINKLDMLQQTMNIENSNILLLINHLSNKDIMNGGAKVDSTSKSNKSSSTIKSTSTLNTSDTNSNTTNTSITDMSTTVETTHKKSKHISDTSNTNATSITSPHQQHRRRRQKSDTKSSDTNTISDLNINSIDIRESLPTENTRSLIKSININSTYNSSSLDTFTITD